MNNTGRLNFVDYAVDDLTNLVELSDESLLANLEARYNQQLIYTYIGSILISINPYKELGIYDEKHISSYKGRTLNELSPHIFGIGEVNYQKMIRENENQVIVISGESGSGKTECFKRILKYLAYSSGGMKSNSSKEKNPSFSTSVSKKVLESTPLLESFGNAKTIRNDNSSRFGKYVEVFFENGKICGSRITNYLLEKSRIVNINPNERGYHIFYEILQGLDSYSKSQYYLKEIKDYAYLNKSSSFSVDGKNDAKCLTEFMEQWNTLGLTPDELDTTLRIISAVLHLGNIEFGQNEDESFLTEMENLKIVSKMLQIDMESLKNCLTTKMTDTVRDAVFSPISKEHAMNFRDTLAKHLYTELFNWIIGKVNECLNKDPLSRSTSKLDKSLNSSNSKFRSIAMLDIYGFENFPENSLEQLCINYANETLQQFFNRYVFELEQAEYKQEGISWHFITYPDNQTIIDLLSAKPSGIIQILNDECSIPQGSDQSFLMKCDNVNKKNKHFEKPKSNYPPRFMVHHFAGIITYNVNGFLEKNRDILRKEMMSLIEHCKLTELSNMFKKKIERLTKNPLTKSRTPAVMADFQSSLALLLTKMKQSEPWFIRCLKPNTKKQAMTFNNDMVMEQMQYTGILETVKIRKSGFPIRIMFSVFLARFYLLQSSSDKRKARSEPKEVCFVIMQRFGGQKGTNYEIGKTKLFLRERFARHLESQVRKIQDLSARIIQRKWRAYWKIRVIEKMNEAATVLQAIARGFIERRRIRRFKIAIVKLQAFVRMQKVRRQFLETHPQFLKYVKEKEEEYSGTQTSTFYKFPKVEIVNNEHEKSKIKKKPARASRVFNYESMKIPIELAYLLDKSKNAYGRNHSMTNSNLIVQVGRIQHLWNRDDYHLPEDIDDYSIKYFLEDYGNVSNLESKSKPISAPLLKSSLESDELKEQALNAHRLILRLIHVDSMPWQYHYLTGSYLQLMALKSEEIQKEILLQVISETVPTSAVDGGPRNVSSKKEIRRIKVAWTLLGNLLSDIKPSSEIFKYVLKYISDAYNWDQAITCQEKLLQMMFRNQVVYPRLFPATNLEWRANTRGSKTCLKINHADGNSNIVYANSLNDSEYVACQSLCFRLNRYRQLKGWSLSIVYPDLVVDIGGHNYPLDAISACELPSAWDQTVGYSLEHCFLVATKSAVQNQFAQRSQPSSHTPRIKRKKDVPSISSSKSIDNWINNIFHNSLGNDELSTASVNMMIHGLEDKLPPNRINQPSMSNQLPQNYQSPYQLSSLPAAPISTYPGFLPTSMSAAYYQPPQFNPQARALEDQLNFVQLENRLIQSNIEKQLLQNQYQQMQQQLIEPPVPANIKRQAPKPPISPQLDYTETSIARPQQTVTYGNYTIPQEDRISSLSIDSNDNAGLSRTFDTRVTKAPSPPPPIKLPNGTGNTSPQIQFNDARTKRISYGEDKSPQIQEPKTKLRDRKRSIIKYSEINEPTNIIVDDSLILPEFKSEQPNKSYLRAKEVPKFNFANRVAHLETFFKEKNNAKLGDPINVPKRKKQAPSLLINTEQLPLHSPLISPQKFSPESSHSFIQNQIKLERKQTLIPRPEIGSELNILSEIQPNVSTQRSLIRSPSPKKYHRAAAHKATILSGIPDIRYFTYSDVNWFVQLRKEFYMMNDIQDSTILNTAVFCQVVLDCIHIACSRWIGREKENIISILGEYAYIRDVNDLCKAPKQIMLDVINEAQKAELYFSRFYAIYLDTSGPITKSSQFWIAISHTGIRLVEQNLSSIQKSLQIINKHPYKTVKSIKVEGQSTSYGSNSMNNRMLQQITISTKSNKIKFLSIYGDSIKSLIEEFLQYSDGSMIGHSVENVYNGSQSSINIKSTKKQRKHVQDSDLFNDNESGGMITYSATKQRIPMPGQSSSSITAGLTQFLYGNTIPPDTFNNEELALTNRNRHSRKKDDSSANLIDFTVEYSKYKNKNEVIESVLLYQSMPLNQPILPYYNKSHFDKAIEIHKTILSLCHSIGEQNQSIVNKYAEEIMMTALQNKEMIEEILLQIFKQINGNPNQSSSQNLWYLLDLMILYVGPTKRIDTALTNQLKQISKNKSYSCHHLAQYSLKYLKSVNTYGTRKELPLEAEFENILRGVCDGKFTIFLPKDSMEININFSSTINDVIATCCQTIGVSDRLELAEYSLAVWHENEDTITTRVDYLQPGQYIYDVINSLTNKKHTSCTFYFNRTSWLVPLTIEERSPRFIELMFNQLTQDIVNGIHILPKKPMHIQSSEIQFAMQLATLSYRGQELNDPITEDLLHLLLPDFFFTSHGVNIPDVCRSIETYLNNESSVASKSHYQNKFLEKVEKFPHFGFLRFPISTLNKSNNQHNLYLVFGRGSIIISDEHFKSTFIASPFQEILDFRVHLLQKISGKSYAEFTINIKHKDFTTFITEKVSELIFLLNHYLTIKKILES